MQRWPFFFRDAPDSCVCVWAPYEFDSQPPLMLSNLAMYVRRVMYEDTEAQARRRSPYSSRASLRGLSLSMTVEQLLSIRFWRQTLHN